MSRITCEEAGDGTAALSVLSQGGIDPVSYTHLPYAAAGLLFPRILHLKPEGRAAANGAVNAEGEAVLDVYKRQGKSCFRTARCTRS